MNEATKIKPKIQETSEFDRDFLDLIKLVLLELRTHSPFLGIMASEMWIAGASKSIPTIGVSERGVVVYNESFMKSLTMGEIIGVLIHESLHVALDYWDRFRGSNMEIANWAHDYAINDIIKKGANNMVITKKNGERYNFKVDIPAGGLWDRKFDSMSGEEIYADLMKAVTEKAMALKEQFQNQMNDPAARAEALRQKEIQDELKKSLAAGGKKVQEKHKEASQRLNDTPITDRDIALEEQSIAYDALRSKDTFSLEQGVYEAPEDDEPNTPDDQQPEQEGQEQGGQEQNGQGQDQEQGGQGQGQDQEQGGQEQNGQGQGQDQEQGGQEQSGQSPSSGDATGSAPGAQGGSGGDAGKSYDDVKNEMKQDMMGALNDYMDKEKDRIESEMDGGSPEKSRSDHLDDLGDRLDEIANEYRDAIENASDEPGQEAGEPGQEGQDQPGDSQDGQGEPGDGQGQPGGQDQPGDSQDGQGEPGDGQGEPGDGQGEPGDGQGQPGGQGGQPSGQAPTKRQAENHIKDALDSVMDEASKAMGGKESGVKGMASGDQMTDHGAMQEAIRQMAEEIGQGDLQGDVNMDCSDIPGNPYAKETKEETKNRHIQTLQRAVVQDAQMGGQGWGAMPAWARRDIEGVLNPPLSLSKQIRRFIGSYGRKDSVSFKKPNRRNSFLPNTPMLPGRKKDSSKVYLLLDTSGSMMNSIDMDTLRRAMGLVKRLSTSNGLEVTVVQCDAGMTKVMDTRQALKEIAQKKFEVVGQGGSDFSEGFDFIWNQIKDDGAGFGAPIIVFTDGGITVPDMPPRNDKSQVLWITAPGHAAPTTKWGKHFTIDDSVMTPAGP